MDQLVSKGQFPMLHPHLFLPLDPEVMFADQGDRRSYPIGPTTLPLGDAIPTVHPCG